MAQKTKDAHSYKFTIQSNEKQIPRLRIYMVFLLEYSILHIKYEILDIMNDKQDLLLDQLNILCLIWHTLKIVSVGHFST